jgi:hypothetical protein
VLIEFAPGQTTFRNSMELAFYLEALFCRRVDLVTELGLNRHLRPYNFVLLMHPPFRRVHLPGPSKNFVLLMHPPFRRVHLETRRVSQTPAVPAVAPRVTMPGGKPCRQFDARDHSIFRGDVSEYSELYESSATLFTEEPFGFFLPGTLQPRRALRAGRRLMRSYADNLTSSSW